MRYRWEIRTGDTWYAGTDANVFISLAGDKGSMKEMEINDPDSNNDWEKGDINHGIFETADLGFIATGTLRHDGAGASPDWTVDYVKITNDEDGRVWLAGVNTEIKGNQPYRLVFRLTDRGQYDEMQRRAREDATKRAQDDEDAQAKAEEAQADREAAAQEPSSIRTRWCRYWRESFNGSSARRILRRKQTSSQQNGISGMLLSGRLRRSGISLRKNGRSFSTVSSRPI